MNADQIGYMSSTSCFENIRLISGMIAFCKIRNNPCMTLLDDFEKVFDSINRICVEEIWTWQKLSEKHRHLVFRN